jgi:hypothetical protein
MQIELMRDPARDLAPIAQPDAVRTARLWHCKYRSLSGLATLTGLEGLAIATWPDDSLSTLAGLKHLRYLSIVHLPKVSDLGPLRELESLESLALATLPSWDSSSRRTEVESLGPLASLHQLRHVELLGVVPADKSLEPLVNLSSLQTARLHGYAEAAVSRFFEDTAATNAHAPEPWF